MKLNKLFGGLALTAVLGVGMASCSNNMEPKMPTNNGDMLLRAPRAVAYAGNEKWDPFTPGYSSKGTRAGAEFSWGECSTSLINREHEKEIIEEWLPEKNGNLKEGIDSDFLFYADKDLSLEFYPVYSQTTTQNDLGVFYWDADGNYTEVIVWEGMNPWQLTESSWAWSEEKGSYEVVTSKGIQINVPEGCTFGFFWKGHIWKLGDYSAVETTYYSSSKMNDESYCTDGGGAKLDPEQTSKIHAVTFQLEGKTYLGLEDWTDFDFQDWVFTCDQELKTVDASTFEPGKKPEPTPDPETPDVPEGPEVKIPDVVDPGFTVDPEQPEVPEVQIPDVLDPGFTVDPEQPEKPAIREEVEINLALDEKEDDNVRSSHLSIHVRTATDVEVFIPVPRKYYCDADDMAIVMQHEANHMGHGGPNEFTWTLKDSDLSVSLFVQYEDDGIRIWTDGITQEVIDWCYEKCQDGITFEVWNYFNDEDGNPLLSNEELRDYLNQATVKFLDKVPDYYVNSFADPNGKYGEGNPNGDDFHVTPENPNEFDAPYEGPHYNNSEVNDIYTRNNAPAPAPVY